MQPPDFNRLRSLEGHWQAEDDSGGDPTKECLFVGDEAVETSSLKVLGTAQLQRMRCAGVIRADSRMWHCQCRSPFPSRLAPSTHSPEGHLEVCVSQSPG